jgi:hypothetical protein
MFVKLYAAVTLSDKEAVVVLLSSVLNISLRYIGIIGTITIYNILSNSNAIHTIIRTNRRCENALFSVEYNFNVLFYFLSL